MQGFRELSTSYAFIDGASFEASTEQILRDFEASFDQINWQALTKNADRIFYFDALPVPKKGGLDESFSTKLKAKEDALSKLRRVPNMHVRLGFTRRRDAKPDTLSQKAVDISLAVEVMLHSLWENISVARLFVNDLDFFPLLDALTKTKVKTELFYNPTKTAPEMIEAADTSQEINHYTFHSALPDFKKVEYQISAGDPANGVWDSIAKGRNPHGDVFLTYSKNNDRYMMEGKVSENSPVSAMSKSKPLIVSYFEFVSMTRVSWSK